MTNVRQTCTWLGLRAGAMTAIFLAALSMPGLLRAQSLAYSNAVVSLNPAGYWPMHETTAAAPGDIETNYGSLGALGNAFYPDWEVNSGAFIRQQAGPLANGADEAVYFTEHVSNVGSSTNSLFIPHTSPLTTLRQPFTIELWFMITNLPVSTFQGDIISQCNGQKDQGFRIYFQNSGTNTSSDSFNILFYNTTTLNQGFQVNLGGVPTNTWHQMVYTVDSNANVTGYLDGALANGDGLNPRQIPSGRYSPDIHDPLTIGNGLGNQRGFNGLIAEVAIYTNVINDITNHYQDATNVLSSASQYFNDVITNNPIIYLLMNGSPYTAPASSTWPAALNYGQINGTAVGNGVYTPGTVPAAVTATAFGSCPLGLMTTNATMLSGVSSFIDAGNAAVYDPAGTTPFTISAVFRGNPTDTNRVQCIAGHGTNSWELNLTLDGYIVFNSGTNSTAVVGTGAGAGDLVSTTSGYDDGNWHWVVAVHNGTTNILYVDDIANNTNVVAAGSVGNSLDAMIGSDPCYTNIPSGWATVAEPFGLGEQFAGQISDAAYFTNALTAAQVQTLYNGLGIPPFIKTQPVSAAIGSGIAFTNTVAVGGSALVFQWYTNNVAFGGQTNANLILNPDEANDSSTNYYLVATNFVGAVTSSVVSIAVYTIPTILSQLPITYSNVLNTNFLTLYAGANPTFSSPALAAPPYYYQWFTNGAAFGGATNPTLKLANVQVGTINTYCLITNYLGSATSGVWSASIIPDPTNSSNGFAPYPQSVLSLNPVGYWRLNDTNLDGPDNGGGDNGYICHDYANGNDGIYTNLALNWPGYNPTMDPSDSSAQFGEVDENGDSGDSLAYGITGINFGAPSGTSVAFTVEAWVEGYVQSYDAGMLTLGYSGAEQFDLDCGSDTSPTTHGFRFLFRDAGGTAHTVSSLLEPTFGSWYHLVAVVDEITNHNVVFYTNGVPAGTASVAAGAGALQTSYLLGIGSKLGSATGNYSLQYYGNINDAAAFNYALTPSQVANQYDAAGGVLAPYFMPSAPTNGSSAANQTLTIPVTAVGTPPLAYFWTNVTASAGIASGAAANAGGNVSLSYGSVPLTWNGNQLELTVSNAYGMTNVFMTLTITNGINTHPTNIVFAVASNQLTLSWPSDHTGWQLQAQTNNLSVGLTTNWVNVTGTTGTNQVVIPLNLTNGSVFYRLVY